ncbi:MAG: PA14 domain-containing protein, partial [Verrucomicrobiota bacterium]
RDGAGLTGATGSALTVGPVEAGDEGAEFACTVTNAFGEVTSAVARLAVTSNARPVAEILTPASGTLYRGGDILSFSGRGLDAEDGTLPAASLTWKIDFHHDDHLHPAMAPRTGLAGGTYAIPRSGEVSANVWFRLHLTVTDSEGLSATTTRDVHPRTVELRLRTEPPGLRFYLDGAPAEEALTVAAVTGVERTLFAPHPQILEGIGYRFTGWAHGGAQTQTLVAPETDTTYVATFAPDAAALGDGLRGEYFADTDEFSGSPDLVRVDETIDFRWGFEGPGEGLGVDNFAVRWTGQLLPAYSETYTFTTNSDDGVRLWVDDQLLIDRWQPQGERAYAGTLRLEGGRRYPIRLEYFDSLGAAVAELRWNSTHEPFGPIPRERLFSEPVVLHVETLDGAAGEEGDQTARWGLRRSGPREAPLPVSYHFEGLAEEGVDYTVVRPSPEPFAAGVESVEWFVTVLPDDLAEGPEHAALVVAPDIAYGFHDDGRATMIFSDSVRGQWWVERFGGRTEANAPAAAEEADSDGDGWSNLLEYALDTDPLAPPADWRPAIALTPVDGQDYWVFSLERDSDVPPDVRLLLEVAAAPEGPWAEARALPGEAETLPDGRMRIAWRDVQPAATGERRFFRLKLVDR